MCLCCAHLLCHLYCVARSSNSVNNTLQLFSLLRFRGWCFAHSSLWHDASMCKISNVTYHFAARQSGEHKRLANRRWASLLRKKEGVFPQRLWGENDCFLRCSVAPAFPTVTVTEAFWDRLWPRLAGLEGVSAVSPGTSWHRVPTHSAAAAAG